MKEIDNSTVLDAVINNKTDALRSLINNNIDLNKLYSIPEYGYSTLCNKIIYLYNQHRSTDAKPKVQEYPLIVIATILKHTDIVKILITGGANIEQADIDEKTALHWASYMGSVEMVDMLLDNRSKIDSTDKRGYTPLFYASSLGHLKVVQLLLSKGADIHHKDKDGYDILVQTVHANHKEVINVIKCLKKHGLKISKVYEDGWGPLVSATFKGNKEMIDFLIKEGAMLEVDDKNNYGIKAARYIKCQKTEHPEIVKEFIKLQERLQKPCKNLELQLEKYKSFIKESLKIQQQSTDNANFFSDNKNSLVNKLKPEEDKKAYLEQLKIYDVLLEQQLKIAAKIKKYDSSIKSKIIELNWKYKLAKTTNLQNLRAEYDKEIELKSHEESKLIACKKLTMSKYKLILKATKTADTQEVIELLEARKPLLEQKSEILQRKDKLCKNQLEQLLKDKVIEADFKEKLTLSEQVVLINVLCLDKITSLATQDKLLAKLLKTNKFLNEKYIGFKSAVEEQILKESTAAPITEEVSMQIAIQCEQAEIIHWLLTKVAHISQVQQLYFACKYNKLELVKLILDTEKQPLEKLLTYKDANGDDAISIAKKQGHDKIVELLAIDEKAETLEASTEKADLTQTISAEVISEALEPIGLSGEMSIDEGAEV